MDPAIIAIWAFLGGLVMGLTLMDLLYRGKFDVKP